MTYDFFPEHEKALRYVVDFWRLHPALYSKLMVTTMAGRLYYGDELWAKVNAATEGDLERIVGDSRDVRWMFAWGGATVEFARA